MYVVVVDYVQGNSVYFPMAVLTRNIRHWFDRHLTETPAPYASLPNGKRVAGTVPFLLCRPRCQKLHCVGTLTPSYADVVRSTDGSVASQ
jgi:hypothetical protein